MVAAIFDVEVDNTEEAPWREPGVDISDFFNYGMSETSWKVICVYCPSLDPTMCAVKT